MSANSVTIPTSIGGLNSDSPPDEFPMTDATIFENLIAKRSKIQVRPGYVDTGVDFTVTSGGNNKIACLPLVQGNLLIIMTKEGVDKLEAGVRTGLYNDATKTHQWQYCIFNKYIFMVMFQSYGTVAYGSYKYDGTTWSATGYTGATWRQFCPHRGRMYAIGDSSGLNLYYGGVNAVTGAMTLFDAASVLNRGGYLIGCISLSRETTAGDKSQLAVLSSEGEVLIYDGDYPGAANWVLVRRLEIPKPTTFGYTNGTGGQVFDAWCNVGDDAWVMTSEGPVSLKGALSGNRFVLETKVTDEIASKWNQAPITTDGSMDTIFYYKSKNVIIINTSQSDAVNGWDIPNYTQYVIFLATGAVSKFTGWPAAWFTEVAADLYFVGRRNDYNIYKAWTVTTDNTAAIAWEYGSPWTQLGTPNSKKVSSIKPVIKSAAADSLTTKLDADLVESNNGYTSTLVANTYQQGWIPVIGSGKRFRVRLSGSTSVATELGSIEALVSQGSSK